MPLTEVRKTKKEEETDHSKGVNGRCVMCFTDSEVLKMNGRAN